MPLYEWECLACDIRFEDLASVSEGRLERECPNCGRMSPRVVSTFAIASGASPQPQTTAQTAKSASDEPPICLRYPHIPLLCHMDKPTAERAVAHAQGRGAEYDDRKGQAEETRKKRGLPPPAPPKPPAHAHFHNPRRHRGAGAQAHGHAAGGHDHAHDHSPKNTAAKGQKGSPASTP